MGKLYDPEPGITVETDQQGRPAAVTWHAREPVDEVVNRWRVDDDWWRVPISRMYWVVTTPTMLLEIFQEARERLHIIPEMRLYVAEVESESDE